MNSVLIAYFLAATVTIFSVLVAIGVVPINRSADRNVRAAKINPTSYRTGFIKPPHVQKNASVCRSDKKGSLYTINPIYVDYGEK